MLQITCTGAPYEIGLTHGQHARQKVQGSIDFYAAFFRETSGLDWAGVERAAQSFTPSLRQKWPAYFDEMRGVADGAGVPLLSVVALNVRTEIAFGMLKEQDGEDGDAEQQQWVGNGEANGNGNADGRAPWDQDGCTSLAWKAGRRSWLAQNWDWREEQKQNLVCLTVRQQGVPAIKMVTEAGIIGKIGLNDAGVGVCLNAIRAHGVDPGRLPVHLGLRMVLESRSAAEAEERLRAAGIASACTMVVADPEGGFAMECSAVGFKKVEMDSQRRVFHSNHFLVPQPTVVDTQSPKDTLERIVRIQELADAVHGEPDLERLTKLFSDEKGWPASICRAKLGKKSLGASLFNIIMELQGRKARVTVGRLVQPEEVFWMEFGEE